MEGVLGEIYRYHIWFRGPFQRGCITKGLCNYIVGLGFRVLRHSGLGFRAYSKGLGVVEDYGLRTRDSGLGPLSRLCLL